MIAIYVAELVVYTHYHLSFEQKTYLNFRISLHQEFGFQNILQGQLCYAEMEACLWIYLMEVPLLAANHYQDSPLNSFTH